MITSRAVRILWLAVAYSASVFALGFALGVVRTLWIAPRLGERAAELAEMPLMVAASFFVARALLGREGDTLDARGGALVGAAALALLLGAEFALVSFVRGQTLAENVAARDPVSGSAYALALLLFAAMPAAVASRRPS